MLLNESSLKTGMFCAKDTADLTLAITNQESLETHSISFFCFLKHICISFEKSLEGNHEALGMCFCPEH
jgi:hypothetical protein